MIAKKHKSKVARDTKRANPNAFLVVSPIAKPAIILSMLTANEVKIKNIKKFIVWSF